MTITLEQQIACVRRELAMRKNVYPKWVHSGRMKQEKADHEIEALQAVHDTLTASIGEPVDPRFRPTRADLDALRSDYAALVAKDERLTVSVSVAPAVLYMSWPNLQYEPGKEESAPYRCISFHIPLPAGYEEERARLRQAEGAPS